MTNDNLIGAALVAYAAIACVAFGFYVKTFIAQGVASIIFGMAVAGVWPVSLLVWLGAWLA